MASNPPDGPGGPPGGSGGPREAAPGGGSASPAAPPTTVGGALDGFLASAGSGGAAAGSSTAALAAMFSEDLEDSDMGRLQAVLEARGFPPHLAGVLGPRMHHLILNRAMAPSATSKAQQLLQGLQATGDESRQLQAVIEMCQLLVMGNEDTLTGFPIRQVVPALIVLLKMEHNFDLMNHACRALTYMMEALPRSSTVIVDAIPTFLEKLQSIQCMDVAEQSLSALEMLSKKHNKAILHAKGVMACLMFLDFFSITAQRNALTVTSNCCQGLLAEEFVHVQDALTILSSRLVHDDKKSSESACTALSRLAESYKNDKNRLRDIAKPEVLANLQKILITSPPNVSSNTFVTVLHILVIMTSNGSEVGPLLMEESIGSTLRQLLVGPSTSSAEDFDLVQRNPQELYEITCLIAEMMPPLPADGIFAVDALLAKPGAFIRDPVLWQWQDDRGNWHTYGFNDCRVIEAAFVAGEDEVGLNSNGKSFTLNLKSMHEIREENGTARPIQRKLTSQLQADVETQEKTNKRMRHLALTEDLTKELLPILLEVYSTSAGPGVRQSCIQAFLRMIYHSPSDLLLDVLRVQTVSSQIAGMLSSGDLKIIVGALQLSELLLQKMPEEFGVHFRREGVLHQVQKLTDPDNPICISTYNESPLSNMGWSSSSASVIQGPSAPLGTGPSGRSWTVTGSSFASMLPDQLRVPKRRDESSSSPDATPHPPLRLSDMLKRKRVSKRSSGRKGRHSDGGALPQDLSEPSSSQAASAIPVGGGASSSGGADLSFSSSPPNDGGPATPSRRSRLADRTSSLLSQLNPSRWGRGSSSNPLSHGHESGSSSSSGSAVKRGEANSSASIHKSISSPATMAHSREKAKRWVREQASRFLEAYFKESLGSRHPALTILRRLSAQVDHLTKKPKDGERSLREILSVLIENDISPFEVTQSGLVLSLLTYLTKVELEGHEDISRESRIRCFLHVFMGCPRNIDSEDLPDTETAPKFLMFVQKMTACVNHLEQFPIKMHDMTSGSSGVKSAGSTLRFFKSHHLKCSLQRHPDCSSLKSWKGGLVKIDPLALVQAIERYLITRGYGYPQDKDSGGSDDDMSDDGAPEDMLPSSSRERMDAASHRLEFSIGEHVLPYDMTVYQAVQQFGAPVFEISDSDSDTRNSGSSMFGSPGIWARIHTIYYRPASEREEATTSTCASTSKSGNKTGGEGGKKGKGSKQSKRKAPDELWNDGSPPERPNPLDGFMVDKLPKFITQDPSLDVLCLLRVVQALNRYWGSLYPTAYYHPIISPSELINSKLTAKVNRQLQDPIIIMTSNLPSWLKEVASVCPYLFPFETRQLLFYVTSFDRDRALLRLLDSVPELGASESGQERVTPDLDRKKRVISRDSLLKQAEQVVNELAHSRSLLEIQYENEVGTGLGPTLEFYTLVSKEMQRADLNLWKGDTVKISSEDVMDDDENADDCIEYVHSSTGLYPSPLARNIKSSHKVKVKNKFQFLGKFIAKAVLDNRMIDLPFSQPFYQWLLKAEQSFTTRDLMNIDPTIANTVTQLEGIVRKKRKLEEDDKITPNERLIQIKSLTMDGCPVEDLGLDFTLPGYPNIELRKSGKHIPVTLDNLHQYVKLVSHWMLIEGVSCQMESIREGFESVFPLESLQMFYPDELDQIFCGSMQGSFVQWDSKTLAETCKPDHGFNPESQGIQFLYEVVSSYSREEQREFLQFVTGCPRLPVGGFKSLSPPLTIVKKTFDSPDVNPDDYLPSVMTCVNYLKLPDYSSKKIMRDKLRVASQEGQYSFHLS
eukprot:maker-scaffold15_size728074-snap-gene-6.27 protein:Tk08879 transcript:maker-scaffold15_size728074-snap-gene-6.27-mRNA-1 annotation:"e3 ubiquitin-protein ligase trip12 isoform x2"